MFSKPNLARLMISLAALLTLTFCSRPATEPSPVISPKPEAPPVSLLPPGYPQPVISGNIPLEVPLPPNPSPDPVVNRPFFDIFSWQSFIALNWPASDQGRGNAQNPNDPAVFRNAAPGTIVVWGTYKETFELFGQGDNRPTPFDSWVVAANPCINGEMGKKAFMQANKGSNLLDGMNEAFSFPLIDQHLNYAYSDVRFDRAQYDFVRGTDGDETTWLYLMKNLMNQQMKGTLTMPASTPPDTLGAMMVKGTWRIMTDKDDQTRYYVVDSQIYDPDTKNCLPATMGLVGFHIAQKTQEFPQWVWSTFAQVDNVAPGPGAPAGATASFNNGTADPPTPKGWANRPPAKVPPLQAMADRVAVQVSQVNPIPNTPPGVSTQDINKAYQQLLQGTVWEHYQLLITQWPTDPTTFKVDGLYPEECGGAFPVNGAVNPVMETYFQTEGDAAGAGGNSCMSCHYTSGNTDFSWVLKLKAH